MAPIDEALRRIAVDQAFRDELVTNPVAALRHYPLNPDELRSLAAAAHDTSAQEAADA